MSHVRASETERRRNENTKYKFLFVVFRGCFLVFAFFGLWLLGNGNEKLQNSQNQRQNSGLPLDVLIFETKTEPKQLAKAKCAKKTAQTRVQRDAKMARMGEGAR